MSSFTAPCVSQMLIKSRIEAKEYYINALASDPSRETIPTWNSESEGK